MLLWGYDDMLEFQVKSVNYSITYIQYNIFLRIQPPCQMMIGVYNHLLRKVFRFHYHSQKVIGSLGFSFTSQKMQGIAGLETLTILAVQLVLWEV